MSSKINLQTCEYARKSSIFQDNQLICNKYLFIVITSSPFDTHEIKINKVFQCIRNQHRKTLFIFIQVRISNVMNQTPTILSPLQQQLP